MGVKVVCGSSHSIPACGSTDPYSSWPVCGAVGSENLRHPRGRQGPEGQHCFKKPGTLHPHLHACWRPGATPRRQMWQTPFIGGAWAC